MTEEQLSVLKELKELFETLEKHPQGSIPIPGSSGNFFPIYASSYYHDAESLCKKAYELKKLLGKDNLFNNAELESTRNKEVKILLHCDAKTKESEVRKYMKTANNHLFRDLHKIRMLIKQSFNDSHE